MTPAQLSALRTAASMHVGLDTFAPVARFEAGYATDLVSSFDYTDPVNWESWFDQANKIGVRMAFITAMYASGFALWDSPTWSRNSKNSPVGRDLLRYFCDLCDIYGIEKGVYYSVGNYYYDLQTVKDYNAFTVEMLRQVFSYAPFQFIFVDAYGDKTWLPSGGLGYAYPDYDLLRRTILAASPGCAICINDRAWLPPVKGDFGLYERPVDGPRIPPGSNVLPAYGLHDPMHKDWSGGGYIGRWYYHSDSPAEAPVDAQGALFRRHRTHVTGNLWIPNWSPGPDGKMATTTGLMLDEFWHHPGTLVVDDVMTSLTNFVKISGATFTVGPAGVYCNGLGIYRYGAGTYRNCRVVIRFKFLTMPTTCTLVDFMRAAIDLATSDQTALNISGSAMSVSLVANGATLDNPSLASYELLEVGPEYELVITKNQDDMRSELWMPANGVLELWGKAFGSSSENDTAGHAGIFISTTASATTGLQITRFQIYTPNTDAPDAPSLTHSYGVPFFGGAPTHFLQIDGLDDRAKIYRSADGGLNYQIVGIVTDAEFVDAGAEHGATYLYKATTQDAGWNVSADSNEVEVTYMTITDQLLADWRLNEVSGNALPAFGGMTLADVGGVTSGTGKVFALARSFAAASSQSLVINDNAALSLGTGISRTTAVWVKATTLPGAVGIITKDDLGAGGQREFNLYYNLGRFVAETFGGSGGAGYAVVTANTFGAVTTGNWYFIVVTVDWANALLKISVNDVEDSVSFPGLWDGTAQFRVGAWSNNGAGASFWNGLIGPLSMWSRALSAVEKTYLHNSGTGRPDLFVSNPALNSSEDFSHGFGFGF